MRLCASSPRPRPRSSSTTTPAAPPSPRPARRGLPARARHRSGVGVRRHRGREPPRGRRAGARAVGDVPRVRDRAGLRARGAGAAGAQEEPAPARPRRDRGRHHRQRSSCAAWLAASWSRPATTRRRPWPPPRWSPSARRRAAELADLDFAWRVCKHVKSNAIVFAAGGRTLGDRRRADVPRRFGAHRDRQGARAAGRHRWWPPTPSSRSATASTRPPRPARSRSCSRAARCATARSIAAADEHGIAMVFTGERHFRH